MPTLCGRSLIGETEGGGVLYICISFKKEEQ